MQKALHVRKLSTVFFGTFSAGSGEVKLPTIWTDGKARWKSRDEEKRREEEKEDQRRENHKKENPGVRKGRKVAKHFISNELWFHRV